MAYDLKNIPRHVAIIMDGNGRWARNKGLPRFEGHRAGASVVKEATRYCLELGIGILSLYTFSTENWHRPGKEVNALMRLLERYLKNYLPELKKNKIRLVVSGERKDLTLSLQRQIQKVIGETKDNSRLILNLALNYGGRQDILQAAKAIDLKVKREVLKID